MELGRIAGEDRERLDLVILAGGLGTRLSTVVSDVPKPLAPVGTTPFLDLLLRQVAAWGCAGRVVLAVSHMASKIRERYEGRRDFGFEILFSLEEEPLGTGGAIKKALALVGSQTLLAMNGDSFADVDCVRLLQSHAANMADMTMVVRRMEDAGRYGTVAMDGDGRIVRFEEKKPKAGGYINAGVYVLEQSLFEEVAEGVRLSLEEDLFPRFLEKRCFGFVTEGRFIDIGTPEAYARAEKYLEGGKR